MSPRESLEELFDTGDHRIAARAFFSLAEAIPHPVWSCGEDGRCDFANGRWLEFSDVAMADVIGHEWTEFVHSDDLDAVSSRWTTAKEQRAAFEVECRLRSGAGEYRWFLARVAPLVVADKVVRWLGTSTDIEEQKRAGASERRLSAAGRNRLNDLEENLEEEVALRTRQLRETIAQLEAFTYSLAHDMRAPCRALTNYSQLLLRDHADSLGEEPRNYLQRISVAAERLDSFIRDLLVYSRVAHDKMPLNQIDVNQVLADVIMSSPNFQPPLAELSTRSPLSSVLGNDTLLAQCFSNLLTNACKFVKEGEKPKILIFDERHGDKVRIYVEDNGIGISEADRDRIFKVFERLNPGDKYSGTGVGLSIVRKAVERMGGRVGVVSSPGKGSKFWLELKAM